MPHPWAVPRRPGNRHVGRCAMITTTSAAVERTDLVGPYFLWKAAQSTNLSGRLRRRRTSALRGLLANTAGPPTCCTPPLRGDGPPGPSPARALSTSATASPTRWPGHVGMISPGALDL